MAENPNVCLRLANRPENVLVVRQALTGVADSIALGSIEANDLKTAVTGGMQQRRATCLWRR